MKPPPLTYHRAADAAHAVQLLTELGPEAKPLAGGQSLLPLLAFRLARPSHLVDLGRCHGLDGIRVDGDGLHLGALTTHLQVETCTDPAVIGGWPALHSTMRYVGHLPIRAAGTVGGSVAHGDGLAEWVLLTLLLDAEVLVLGPSGTRRIPAAMFYQGWYTTVLAPNEVVVSVRFPPTSPHAAVAEFARRQGDYAVVAAGVQLDRDAAGAFRGGRVVVSGAGARGALPERLPGAESVLARGAEGPGIDSLLTEAAHAAAAGVDVVEGDLGAGYRRALVGTLVERAARAALDAA